MVAHRDHWFVRETIGLLAPHLAAARCLRAQPLRRHRRRLVLCRHPVRIGARRRPLLHADGRADNDRRARAAPSISGCSRWSTAALALADPVLRRGRAGSVSQRMAGTPSKRRAALDLGLVTVAPDALDWDDEIRLAIEERASLSPDALTGHGGQSALCRAGDHGDADLRPALGVAELDLHRGPTRSGGKARSNASAAARGRASTGRGYRGGR